MRQCCPVLFTEAVNLQPVLQMLQWYFIQQVFLAVKTRCGAQVLYAHSCFFSLSAAPILHAELNSSTLDTSAKHTATLLWRVSTVDTQFQCFLFSVSVRVIFSNGIICGSDTQDHTCLRGDITYRLQTGSSAGCNALFRYPPPPLLGPPWHHASQPAPGFPSYSQLNVFGGFSQGFARSDSILHARLKCISRGFMHKLFILEQCTAKSPLLIFAWLLCKLILSGKAGEQLSCCHQLISRRCYNTSLPCQW